MLQETFSRKEMSKTQEVQQCSPSGLNHEPLSMSVEETPQILILDDGGFISFPQDQGHLTDRGCLRCTFPNQAPVACLCSALGSASSEKHHERCIGVLSSSSNEKIRVCPRKGRGLNPQLKKTISLGMLLTGNVQMVTKKPPRKFKLQLAVLLASSMTQLHGTNWLDDLWGSRDIFFRLDMNGSAVLQEPFVQQVFDGGLSAGVLNATKDDDWKKVIMCNKMLFFLGIVLLEVHHWKSFDMLQTELENDYKSELTKAEAIFHLVKKIFEDAGDNYGRVVKRCLQGLDLGETELTHEGFKTEVYQQIVIPLEVELKNFLGVKTVEEAFNMGK
ncbi:hypothetical protein BDZ91DRAFT_799627 [Kalaharituber pfeilii]|nr:hypothetical protein BDZ91DRAFT_799627 [Kalaharituber pfeilii]